MNSAKIDKKRLDRLFKVAQRKTVSPDSSLATAGTAGALGVPRARRVSRIGRASALSMSFVLAMVVAVLMLVLPGTALAAPVIDLHTAANTTAAPGSTLRYFVIATNVGDQPTSAPLALDVTLPSGITAASADVGPSSWDCSSLTPGASTVTCTIGPGINGHDVDNSRIELMTEIAADAAGTLIAEFDVTGGGAPPRHTVDATTISVTPPQFGIEAFDGQVAANATGDPYTQAGGHPYEITTAIFFNTFANTTPFKGDLWPVEPPKNTLVDLPPGLVGDPTVTGDLRCTLVQLANSEGVLAKSLCSPGSQVGVTRVFSAAGLLIGGNPVPVFNMVAPPDVPARFGFNVGGVVVTLDAALRSGGDYGLSVNVHNVSEGLAIAGAKLSFWGAPADPSHDLERACPGEQAPGTGGPTCTTELPIRAFLRNPTACTSDGTGLETTLRADSWFDPGDFESASFVSHNPPAFPFPPDQWGDPQGPTGCEDVPFEPSFAGAPNDAKAGTPSAFSFDLSLPQTDSPDIVGTSDLRKAVVTLPQGVRVSPSSAGGLAACSSDQIGLDSRADPTCPDASKIGSLTIDTPMLDEPLTGSIYLATPNDNPFDSLLGIYLVAKGPGVIVKLPGKVEADPDTGRLTTTFDDQPQLPFSNLHLEFKGGPRASLVNPPACGTYTTRSVMTGWSGSVVESNSSFTVTDGCGTGFTPKLDAGLENPVAGSKSPFSVQLTRSDSDEEFASLDVTTPQGLAAVLKGVAICPQGAVDAAKSMSNAGQGALELATPACPAASQVGSMVVGAGAGTNPFYVDTGKAYLAGPYKGAPLSLAIVIPALAGPFDLGNVVVQSAIHVDPATAQITVKSDPIPSILHGIPLQLKDIRVDMDRPDFTIAPTSCDPMSVDAVLTSTLGSSAAASSRFQVADCAALGFKPRLRMRLFGPTHRGAHPRLRAVLTMPQRNQANIARAAVTLPGTELLENSHIRTVCTRVKYAADECPAASIYGYARALTPLLDEPLKGPVYLRSSNHTLPDLVASLDGQVHIDLVGRIDSVNGRIRNTFEAVPDVPVSKFVLTMQGGRKGLLVNSSGICDRPQHAIAKFDGQNGKIHDILPRVRAGCGAERRAKRR